jgi:hypothetical protein
MVSRRVRDMTAAGALTGTEKFYADDGSNDVYVTAQQIKTFSGVVAGGGPYVYLSSFGVVGNGFADDTAALNAAFATLHAACGTVIWDVLGFSKTTDTVVVGDNSGPSGPHSFISIICPYGTNCSGIRYAGPTDRPCMIMGKNSYFHCDGLHLASNVARGTTTGLVLGGSGGTGTSTESLAGTFNNCFFDGFHVALSDGNGGSCSEILWNEISIGNCDVGWTALTFNTLDHTFILPSISGNGVGLDSGASEGYHVYGGSASNNSDCDFLVSGNGRCEVDGFRSENTNRFVRGEAGASSSSITIRNAEIAPPTASGSISISGSFGRISIEDSEFTGGWVAAGFRSLRMVNCVAPVDPVTRLPFAYATGAGTGATIFCKQNKDHFQPNAVVADLDYDGTLYGLDTGAGFEGNYSFPPIVKVNPRTSPTNSLTSEVYPTNFLQLNSLRHLSEAPIIGNSTFFNTTLVTNAATAAGSAVLHFASVPSNIVPGMIAFDLTTGAALPAGGSPPRVTTITSTTVTLDAAAIGPGVGNGDSIKFFSVTASSTGTNEVTGKNMRVTGKFAASGTLNFTFKRTVTITTGGVQQPFMTATAGIFYPSDAGKLIRVIGGGSGGWADWFGICSVYLSATVIATFSRQANFFSGGGTTLTIGEDEPDANYMVVGIVGDAATPESYSVSSLTTSGFTVKSSNAASTATITAMIVR